MAIFRYPGGKTKLLPQIIELLYPLINKTNSYYEAFVGGGSVLCKVANDFKDIKLYVNDKDITIYSFWKLFQNNKDNEFADFYKSIKQKPTVKLFNKIKSNGIPKGLIDRAYYSVFLNRTCFSGIISSGPIGGYGQKSKYTIDCRYNAKRIIKECEELRILFNNRINVYNLDCLDFLDISKGAIYLDPPYYIKGKQLYPTFMTEQEHINLANKLKEKNNWLLSYDICKEIDDLYNWSNKFSLNARYSIKDKKESWTNKKEYLIMENK